VIRTAVTAECLDRTPAYRCDAVHGTWTTSWLAAAAVVPRDVRWRGDGQRSRRTVQPRLISTDHVECRRQDGKLGRTKTVSAYFKSADKITNAEISNPVAPRGHTSHFPSRFYVHCSVCWMYGNWRCHVTSISNLLILNNAVYSPQSTAEFECPKVMISSKAHTYLTTVYVAWNVELCPWTVNWPLLNPVTSSRELRLACSA